jgi:hypothetical protein
MDLKIIKSRYLMLIGLALMNIFMFQNCSNWKGQVVVSDKVDALSTGESPRDLIDINTPDNADVTNQNEPVLPPALVVVAPECASSSQPINIGCPSGYLGTKKKVCVDGKYKDEGACTPITCKNLNGTDMKLGDSFSVDCASNMTGSITYECKAQDKVEEVSRSCVDPTTGWLCRDNDTKEVSCNSLMNKSNLLGTVLLTCNKTDHMSFAVPESLDLSSVCREIKCDGGFSITSTNSSACSAGFDGNYVDVCTLNADGVSASFVRSGQLSTCAPIVCKYGSQQLNVGDPVVTACNSDENGDGTTYVCADPDDEKSVDGVGALEFKASDCTKKVCNANTPAVVKGKCADDVRFGVGYVGNILMSCNGNGSAQDVEDTSHCQRITCGNNLFYSDKNPNPESCPQGQTGTREFTCGAGADSASAHGDWVENSEKNTCTPLVCQGNLQIGSTVLYKYDSTTSSTTVNGVSTTVTESCSNYKKCQLNSSANQVEIVDATAKSCIQDTSTSCTQDAKIDFSDCGEDQSGNKWKECTEASSNTWTLNTSQCKSTSCTITVEGSSRTLKNGDSITLYGGLTPNIYNSCSRAKVYRCVSGEVKLVTRGLSNTDGFTGSISSTSVFSRSVNSTEVLATVTDLTTLSTLKTTCTNAVCSNTYDRVSLNLLSQTYTCEHIGKCGSYNRGSFNSEPREHLCASGSTSSEPVLSNGTYTWTCTGNSSASDNVTSCSATASLTTQWGSQSGTNGITDQSNGYSSQDEDEEDEEEESTQESNKSSNWKNLIGSIFTIFVKIVSWIF